MKTAKPLKMLNPRPRSYQKGDRVYYSGANRKLRDDYGNQVLTVLAVDPIRQQLVCATKDKRWLVGVSFADLESDSTPLAERRSEAS